MRYYLLMPCLRLWMKLRSVKSRGNVLPRRLSFLFYVLLFQLSKRFQKLLHVKINISSALSCSHSKICHPRGKKIPNIFFFSLIGEKGYSLIKNVGRSPEKIDLKLQGTASKEIQERVLSSLDQLATKKTCKQRMNFWKIIENTSVALLPCHLNEVQAQKPYFPRNLY